MTTEEGFRVSDLVASASLVLNLLAQGDILAKDDQEIEWLRRTTEAVRKLLPEREG